MAEKKPQECPWCDGSGRDREADRPCGICAGTGRISGEWADAREMYRAWRKRQPASADADALGLSSPRGR